jgi:PPM family protein phosphatase
VFNRLHDSAYRLPNERGGFFMRGEMAPTSMQRKRMQESIPAAVTDIGCERDINEDRYAVIDSSAGRAWIVCDGMGGALGGELAAQLAIDAIRRALESSDFATPTDALRAAIEQANRVIVLRRQNPAFSAMGTTVAAVLVNGDEIVIAYVGDSRVYLVRDGVIQQLTVDHTYVQDLVDRGAINPEDALSHPQAHVLTRCLGAEPRLDVEMLNFWIWESGEDEPEDRLVMCSDGLYSLVSDAEIAEIVTRFSPQESCVQLVELAKQRGGYDNITLAVLPMSGQIREECSTSVKNGRRASPVEAYAARKLPIEKRIAIVFFLVIFGAIVMALALLLSTMQEGV